MRETGLAGASRRRGTGTTRVDPSHRPVPDQVERQFQADAPDRIWVADITYVQTWAGFVYLARISHHPLGGWIIGCELECFFLSVAFTVEPGPVGGWS